jgi:hypothetical protein
VNTSFNLSQKLDAVQVGGVRLKGAELGQARECSDSLFAACAPSKRRWAGKR